MEYESNLTEEKFVKEVSYVLYSGKGWMKFYGIITVIVGILSAISIVGILYAWLPIWLGVLIYGTANKVDMAYRTGDKQAFIEAQKKLNTFFVINSVIILIGIIISAVVLIAFFGGFMQGYLSQINRHNFY